jgi:hypothetical protein
MQIYIIYIFITAIPNVKLLNLVQNYNKKYVRIVNFLFQIKMNVVNLEMLI